MVNPHWLRSFSVLAELGNFTRTADHLGLTQAAVSQHIRHLEEAFGPLLIRRPRGVELMSAGRALLDYCREIEQADKRLQFRLSEADILEGEISMITPGSAGLALYPALLDMQACNPGLTVRFRFAPDSEVLEAVLDNRYELGLLTFKPDTPRLLSRLFTEEPLELVAPAGEMIDGWDDLVRLGFIDHPDGQAMATRLLSRIFPGNPGVAEIPSRGFINQISLILEPVARGFGFTVIPRYAREAFARPDAIRVVPLGPALTDSLWIIYRSEWPLSARAKLAIDHLEGFLSGGNEARSEKASTGSPG